MQRCYIPDNDVKDVNNAWCLEYNDDDDDDVTIFPSFFFSFYLDLTTTLKHTHTSNVSNVLKGRITKKKK